jgi:hypothetical protein
MFLIWETISFSLKTSHQAARSHMKPYMKCIEQNENGNLLLSRGLLPGKVLARYISRSSKD